MARSRAAAGLEAHVGDAERAEHLLGCASARWPARAKGRRELSWAEGPGGALESAGPDHARAGANGLSWAAEQGASD